MAENEFGFDGCLKMESELPTRHCRVAPLWLLSFPLLVARSCHAESGLHKVTRRFMTQVYTISQTSD